MKIPTWFVRDYLDLITIGWFNHHDLPPDSVEEYGPLAENVRLAATAKNELGLLRSALRHALLMPKFQWEAYGGGRYPYEGDEVRDIAAFMLNAIGTGSTEDMSLPVEFVEISLPEWQECKAARMPPGCPYR